MRTRSFSKPALGGYPAARVTPIRSLLEDVSSSVTVLFRARIAADAVLLPELRDLAAARGGQVHLDGVRRIPPRVRR